MSEELEKYLAQMEADFVKVENAIKSDYQKGIYNNELDLLLKNNDKVKTYITHLAIGPGLSDENDNLEAIGKVYKRHMEFMKFFYGRIGWDIIK